MTRKDIFWLIVGFIVIFVLSVGLGYWVGRAI